MVAMALRTIFILVLLLFPLGEIVRINLSNDIILKPIDAGVGLIVIFWLIFKLKKDREIKQKNILVPILLFSGSAFFSLIINQSSLSVNQFFTSLAYLIRWIFYSAIFFVVSDFNKEFKKRILNLLIIVGSLVTGLGYLQYFFYPGLKNLFYLGWDEHMHRMFSVFLDPNFAGTFFVLFFLFLTNLFFKRKNKFIGLLVFLTLGAVFLTFSRSALIMLIVSSSLLLLLLNKKIWIGLLLGVTLLVLTISSKYFDVENINLFRKFSTQARIETSRNAVMVIQDHPIFGIGFNAYRYAQLNYGFRNDNSKIVSHADAGVDNSILFVLTTTGLAGFGFFLFLWFRILKERVKNNPLLLASIVGILINSLFINSLFYTYIMFWLWVIMGIKENK